MGLDLLVLPFRACLVGQDILRAEKGLVPRDDRPGGRVILRQGTREVTYSVRVRSI